MINLLAPEHTSNMRYGHLNALLRRWLIATVLAIAGLILIVSTGWLYIAQQSRNLSRGINDTKQQLQAQNLPSVQKQAMEITGNIKIINQVLSREIRFSELMQQIGSVMPAGAVLSSLSLSKADGAVDLSANGTNYGPATQIAINLSDPAKQIFDKVDIVNINCTNSGNKAYPCNATYKALFGKATKNRFLNVPGGGQ